MSETTIYVAASRAEIRQIIARIPQAVMGDYGAKNAADAIMVRCGMTALGFIKKAFIVKSRGGVDDAGDYWPPLSPRTIAGRRSGRGKNKRSQNTQVDILRDTGLLFNSLSPGVENAVYHNVRSRAAQVFRVGRGEVVVGTNRKWAGVHHRGSRNGRIPQRRLWPDVLRWPSSWWLDIAEQGRAGLLELTIFLIKGSTP